MGVSNKHWHKIRLAVLARDSRLCNYCGADANEVDHVIPRALGGTEDMDNLVAACRRCNRSKGKGIAPKPKEKRFFVASIDSRSDRRSFSPMRRIDPPGFPRAEK